MAVSIKGRSGDRLTLEVEFDLSGSMLDSEESIQVALNEAGTVATGEALKRFDTDGARIVIGGQRWFSKGEVAKIYQTPYGEVEVPRHVYQRSQGGKTFCPLDRDARIVVSSTPRFAKVISHKFANGSSIQVRRDLKHKQGAAGRILREMPRSPRTKALPNLSWKNSRRLSPALRTTSIRCATRASEPIG